MSADFAFAAGHRRLRAAAGLADILTGEDAQLTAYVADAQRPTRLPDAAVLLEHDVGAGDAQAGAQRRDDSREASFISSIFAPLFDDFAHFHATRAAP